MVNLYQIEEQLKAVGCNFRFWGRSEVRELPNILMDGEIIKKCVNGRYEGGFAMLCVTNHRLLLIDRKFMFLSIEDIRFDMISELNYSSQVIDGTVHIVTPNRRLRFNSLSQGRLRELLNYTQLRVMEIRQHYLVNQEFQQPERRDAQAIQVAAGAVGSMAMQGGGGQQVPMFNPYTHLPILLRRRHYPKF